MKNEIPRLSDREKGRFVLSRPAQPFAQALFGRLIIMPASVSQ
jgi:hypothetical protein